MFHTILVANRGEIACRIMRSAQKYGIRCIAVYSDADAFANHVKQADEAHRLGPAPSKESYLQQEKIIAIAKATHAEAIHPGYGFLAENAEFAERCQQAGLVFIGPPATAIAAMGSKNAAKTLMQQHGVPTVPGYHDADQSIVAFQKAVDHIGYPVLIKAAAGGGGKGMRIVNAANELKTAIEAAAREAEKSFADATLLIEKYLPTPRHIEMQLFADSHGNVVHLFERDCSLQRRYQKVIEEARAPKLSDNLREKLAQAAITAAKAIKYVGAGTIEFLVDGEQFYFMEMNTRLQVEHPVTEMITGIDLVEWQLRIAAGEPLPLKQTEITAKGHAMEARVCAEDPGRDYLPATGTIDYLHFPSTTDFLRIDTGISRGDNISMYYDSMIAKIIAWGDTREHARQRLLQALQNTFLSGVKTNLALLQRLLSHSDFIAENLSTFFIRQHQKTLAMNNDHINTGILLATLAKVSQNRGNTSPWLLNDGWRVGTHAAQLIYWKAADANIQTKVQVTRDGEKFILTIDNQNHCAHARWDGTHLFAVINEQFYQAIVTIHAESYCVMWHGHSIRIENDNPALHVEQSQKTGGHLAAPMPGTIIAIAVKMGQSVKRGDVLLTLEAMKMEHTIKAIDDGIIKAIHFAVGQQVQEGAELLVLSDE